MNDDSSFSDSSSMFAQQIVDDRYKREEAKIALMYAREQKKELEQVERSIAQVPPPPLPLQHHFRTPSLDLDTAGQRHCSNPTY